MIAVIGAGALGVALAVQVRRAGQDAAVLATSHDAPFAAAAREGRAHPGLGVPFPDGVPIVEEAEWARVLGEATDVIIAVATQGLLPTLRTAVPLARPDARWAVGTKGWDAETLRPASLVVADEVGDAKRTVALVGPSLANEIALGVPTGIVAACEDGDACRAVAAALTSPTFRVFTSDDIAGVEVGAALKNVIAIAVGMCDGLAETDAYPADALTNTKAFLFSRGLVEMVQLARALGGRAETVLGLAGAGDLFVTCLGGRNGRFGRLIGLGRTPEQALLELSTTVEGYVNARAALALADRHGLPSPIVRTVVRVLFEGHDPALAVHELVSGGVEEEFGS